MHEGKGDGSEVLEQHQDLFFKEKMRTAIWKQKQQDKIVALGGHF